MKKIILTIFLLNSCTISQMYHTENYKNSIKNIEVMMKWLEVDAANGLIQEDTARNYYYLLEVTRNGLLKNNKNDK